MRCVQALGAAVLTPLEDSFVFGKPITPQKKDKKPWAPNYHQLGAMSSPLGPAACFPSLAQRTLQEP